MHARAQTHKHRDSYARRIGANSSQQSAPTDLLVSSQQWGEKKQQQPAVPNFAADHTLQIFVDCLLSRCVFFFYYYFAFQTLLHFLHSDVGCENFCAPLDTCYHLTKFFSFFFFGLVEG